MKQGSLFAALVLAAVLTAVAWSPAPDPPKIPAELRYVCVVDADDSLISIVQPFPFSPVSAEVLKANLRSAVNLAGRSINRADVIEASASIQLVDNPIPPLDRKPRPRRNPQSKDGCHTVCSCATPIFCSTTAPEPSTEAVRRAPGPPSGGICGCGGGCGTCEKCVVVCR